MVILGGVAGYYHLIFKEIVVVHFELSVVICFGINSELVINDLMSWLDHP